MTLTGIGFDSIFAVSREFPGLRAGTFTVSKSKIVLQGVEWIRGVRVSGTIDSKGMGVLTVSGPSAAPGTITYMRKGVSGILGGKAFRR